MLDEIFKSILMNMKNSHTHVDLNKPILFGEVSKRTILGKGDNFTRKHVIVNSSSIA